MAIVVCHLCYNSNGRIHINKWKLLYDDFKYFISLQNNDSKLFKHIRGYATCPIYGTSGTNIIIAITHQEIL